MNRKENWPEKLADYISVCQEKKFRWGTHDCLRFAAGAIEAMTGVDLFDDYFEKINFKPYRNRAEAYKLLGETYEGELERLCEVFAVYNDWPEVEKYYARRGDLAIIPTPEGDALAICIGSQCTAASAKGLAFVSVEQVKRAWRI